MADGTCARCRLPAVSDHEDAAACISALGATLASMRSALDELMSDLAARRMQEDRARELRAEAEADLARGG